MAHVNRFLRKVCRNEDIMRKFSAVALGAMLIIGSVIPVCAQETRQTTINVSIDPTYTVTIPASTTIASGIAESSIGNVTLDNARLEPDKSIWVSADASGKLKNSKDSSKTISYKLMNGNSEFTSASYLASGNSTPLTVSINKSEWDNAYAGLYSDTIVFTISYK